MKDLTGSPVEVGDAVDSTRIALREEVETLQRQIEHLTAEVRLDSDPDFPLR